MRANAEAGVLYLLETLFYVVVPALTIWGWARWARRRQVRSVASMASFIGFAFATASAALAAVSVFWAHEIGGFAYYDRRLLLIYLLGGLLSLIGFVLSLVGISKANPLRWHAIVCAVGTALFWLSAAAGE
jgi:hypothetical protein